MALPLSRKFALESLSVQKLILPDASPYLERRVVPPLDRARLHCGDHLPPDWYVRRVTYLHSILTLNFVAFPGRWMLVESNDPDASPNGASLPGCPGSRSTAEVNLHPGQLPFLEHGPHTISSLSGILAYLSKLSFDDVSSQPTATVTSPTGLRPKSTDLDEGLSEGRRAESVAWKAIVESELADLTARTFRS